MKPEKRMRVAIIASLLFIEMIRNRFQRVDNVLAKRLLVVSNTVLRSDREPEDCVSSHSTAEVGWGTIARESTDHGKFAKSSAITAQVQGQELRRGAAIMDECRTFPPVSTVSFAGLFSSRDMCASWCSPFATCYSAMGIVWYSAYRIRVSRGKCFHANI